MAFLLLVSYRSGAMFRHQTKYTWNENAYRRCECTHILNIIRMPILPNPFISRGICSQSLVRHGHFLHSLFQLHFAICITANGEKVNRLTVSFRSLFYSCAFYGHWPKYYGIFVCLFVPLCLLFIWSFFFACVHSSHFRFYDFMDAVNSLSLLFQVKSIYKRWNELLNVDVKCV